MKPMITVILTAFLLQGCVGSGYKSDFGCKPPAKPQCKSLYEIALEAEAGMFDPDSKKAKGDTNYKCSSSKRRFCR